MTKRVAAKLNNKKVELSSVSTIIESSLAVYEFISDDVGSQLVVDHVPVQNYFIDENSGLINLKTNKKGTLSIKSILFDEVICNISKWN